MKITVGSWGYLIENKPQKFATPHSMGSRKL